MRRMSRREQGSRQSSGNHYCPIDRLLDGCHDSNRWCRRHQLALTEASAMEILTFSIAVLAVIAAFELAAIRFGTDSRDGLGDSPRTRSGGGPI